MPSVIPAFELDGLRFGGDDQPIKVSRFDPGTTDVRSQDTEAIGDGVMMGRDHFGGSSVTFDLFTDVHDYAEALDLADSFAAVWRNEAGRDTPQSFKALRYYMAGRWRRIYGRPRRYTPPDGGAMTIRGRGEFFADFARVNHLYYDDVEQSATASLLPTTIGGFTAPFIAPITMESIEEGYEPGTFTVGGSAPTFPIVEVQAGSSAIYDAWVELDSGWRLQLAGAIQPGETITVDTRPWVRYAARNGTPVSGALARSTDLSALALRPGSYRVTFGSAGANASAKATIRWRPARYSL